MTDDEARCLASVQQAIERQRKTGGVAGEAMTLRDFFASAALTGLVTAGRAYNWEDFATMSYQMADAMIEARK